MTPTEVQVLSVASTSAVVGWLPADSALEHRVVVDDVARVVIRPGGYRCTVTGNFARQRTISLPDALTLGGADDGSVASQVGLQGQLICCSGR